MFDDGSNPLTTQLYKGLLSYCVLRLCEADSLYSKQIIQQLNTIGITVSGGTVYPLLKRLYDNQLLDYEWRESEQGPPRKYYQATDLGVETSESMGSQIDTLYGALDLLP